MRFVPGRRGVDAGCDGDVLCDDDDDAYLDGVWDADVPCLGDCRVAVERPPVDDVPRNDMFRHEVRPSADSRPNIDRNGLPSAAVLGI